MTNNTFKFSKFRIINNGDSGLTVLFDSPTSRQLTEKILSTAKHINLELKSCIDELIPSYQSLSVLFNPSKVDRKDLYHRLNNILSGSIKLAQFSTKRIEVPVCYEPKFATDIERVAEHCQLTRQQVIEQHCQPVYWVAMLGFLPGFVYLSGLKQSLFCPRKQTPSLSVAPGSIAIGNQQTGIYSLASPGGWNVIGRTPRQLFTPNTTPPISIGPLDEIQFVAISAQSFSRIQSGER